VILRICRGSILPGFRFYMRYVSTRLFGRLDFRLRLGEVRVSPAPWPRATIELALGSLDVPDLDRSLMSARFGREINLPPDGIRAP
jgi:hypothetical protein